MRNIVKPRTSTRNVTFRYFFALVSFLLRNAWLYLQKKHFMMIKLGSSEFIYKTTEKKEPPQPRR